MVQKFDMLAVEGGGGSDKNVFVKGELVNRHGNTLDRDGIDTLLMVVSMVTRTWYGVADPLVS